MSWLWGNAPTDPHAPNFHPVSLRYPENEIAGELEPQDIEFKCLGGFVSETQTYYHFLEDGTFILVQVIHSSIGVWYPTIQFAFKMYNPTTKECVWRSTNVTNFVCPSPGHDKRSCKSDQFSLTYKATPGSDSVEKITILANATDDVQISLDITRAANAPGWKIGKGPKSGTQYYGSDIEKPEGFLFHSFWPRTQCSGTIIYKGRAITTNGHGMYVHAVMGMRPNLIASRWNFANFQSNEHGGVSAIQMELTTLDTYGLKGAGSGGVKVNFGSLVLGGKLVSVTTEVTLPGEQRPEQGKLKSRAFHHNLEHDADTDYEAPKTVEFMWAGPTTPGNPSGEVSASLKADVAGGLIEKVDVLAEIPAMVKAVISYVAGTKPYVYQWMNPSSLQVTCSDDIIPNGSSGLSIKGTFYNEASFIS